MGFRNIKDTSFIIISIPIFILQLQKIRSMKFIQILVFSFITLSCFSQSSINQTHAFGNDPNHGKFLNHRGFKMYYEVYGQGEPLLIIHGNGGQIKNFKYQIPFFAEKYQVILAENRSHGKSLDLSDSLSYNLMTDDLNALLDSLHKDSCYVIGWSDGGIEGLLLAINHPQKVKKLAITGANLIPDADLAVDNWFVKDLDNYIDSLARLPNNEENKKLLKLARLMVREPHISHEDLQKINCPTLVIGGDQDVVLPRHTLEIAENIKNSNLWILPNSGHSAPIYYRDIFNKTVSTFFTTPFSKKEKSQKFN